MVDKDSEIRKFSLMDPEQRNIELGVLYDFLPNFEFPESPEPIGSEKWNEEVEALSNRVDQRENSVLKQRLVQRYRKLIAFAPTTESCKDFLVFEYEELFKYGIEQETGESGSQSEYEYWGKILGWNIPENGGIFDSQKAPVIERDLLKKFQASQLKTRFISEVALESDDFQMLLDTIIDGAREDDLVRKMLMSEEEMEEYKKKVEKGDEVAREYIAKEAYTDSLLIRWHSDFFIKYGDEP